MMRTFLAVLLINTFLGFGYEAKAQTSLPITIQPSSEEGADTEKWGEIVTITAKLPGPAVWRIRKGDSEVFIIGSMPVITKYYRWDEGRIDRIMNQASVYIVSPNLKGDVGAFLFFEMTRNKSRRLYDILPVSLTQRFRSLVKKHGLDPKTYEGMHPIVAATRLKDDIYEKNNLSTRDPEKHLIFMARAKGVPMKPLSTYATKDLVKRLKSFNDAEQITCMHRTLNEIDFALKNTQKATEFWAQGQLIEAKSHMPYPSALSCFDGAKSTGNIVRETTDQALNVIRTSLTKPGRTVMVLPLSVLLRQGGAFDQLSKEGADISRPDQPDTPEPVAKPN